MKRFWKEVTVEAGGDGFSVLLDGRPVRTPGKAALAVPAEALARRVAEEWAAQEDEVDPAAMPFTGLVNAALDLAEVRRDEIAGTIAGYGETDLLCYRAEAPEALRVQQHEGWQPLLDWAAEALGARLQVTAGIIPVLQEQAALDALRARIEACDRWALTGLSVLTQSLGSLVLALAVLEGRLEAEDAFALSRLDEAWQESQWGEDAEAVARREGIRRQVLDTAAFLDLAKG